MKLFILSYRANYTKNNSCSCHPHYRTEDSCFDMRLADGLDEAASYIAGRLKEAPHAEHLHILLEKMPGDIPSCIGEAATADLLKKDAGKILWLNPYADDDWEHYEEREAEQKKIDGLVEELIVRIFGKTVQRQLGDR